MIRAYFCCVNTPIYISPAVFMQLQTQLRPIHLFSDLPEDGRISEICWRILKYISLLQLWRQHVPQCIVNNAHYSKEKYNLNIWINLKVLYI